MEGIRTALCPGLAAVLAVVVVGACNSGKPTLAPAGGATTTVPLTTSPPVTVPRPSAIEAFDFRFQPAQLQARSGEQITLAVTNRGNTLHNLTVPSLEGAAIDVPPGQTKNLIFIAPAAGTLEFFCKYHRQQGMTGQIVLTPGSSGSLPFPVRRPPPDSANE